MSRNKGREKKFLVTAEDENLLTSWTSPNAPRPMTLTLSKSSDFICRFRNCPMTFSSEYHENEENKASINHVHCNGRTKKEAKALLLTSVQEGLNVLVLA